MDTIFNIKFEDFENAEWFSGYAYPISNETIDYALEMLENKEIYDLVYSEIEKDWQDAFELSANTIINDSMKDALRIAMLVLLIRDNGIIINPVDIDTFSNSESCLEGHHRLLALKYLKYKEFPAYLSGNMDILESNFNIKFPD